MSSINILFWQPSSYDQRSLRRILPHVDYSVQDEKPKYQRSFLKSKRKTESDESGYGESHTVDYSLPPQGLIEKTLPVTVKLEYNDYVENLSLENENSDFNTSLETIKKQTVEYVKKTKTHTKKLSKNSSSMDSFEHLNKSSNKSKEFDTSKSYPMLQQHKDNSTISRTQYNHLHSIPNWSDESNYYELRDTRSIGVETSDNGRIPQSSSTQTPDFKTFRSICEAENQAYNSRRDKRCSKEYHTDRRHQRNGDRKNLMRLMLSQVKDLKSQITPYINEKHQTNLVPSNRMKKIRERKRNEESKAPLFPDHGRDPKRRLPNLPQNITPRRKLPTVPMKHYQSAFSPVPIPPQQLRQLPNTCIIIASPARNECDDVCDSLCSSSFSCSSF